MFLDTLLTFYPHFLQTSKPDIEQDNARNWYFNIKRN